MSTSKKNLRLGKFIVLGSALLAVGITGCSDGPTSTTSTGSSGTQSGSSSGTESSSSSSSGAAGNGGQGGMGGMGGPGGAGGMGAGGTGGMGTSSSSGIGGMGTGGMGTSSSSGIGGMGTSSSSSSSGSACVPTNGGVEKCDGIDNDCNGNVDDAPVDFTSPKTCGTCTNNCYKLLLNVDPTTIGCTASPNPGTIPGTCTCGACAPGYYDLNNDCICEYACVKTAADDSFCNGKDDDCDGQTDEDVNVCTSTTDCGACGHGCIVANGTAGCNTTAGPGETCTMANTRCVIAACNAGYSDLDGSYATGCESACTPTNGGVEICGDGIDNDCDGKIDGADDLSGDPQIGVACYGDPDGECATPAHAGITACQNNTVVCVGPNILVQGQIAESCNALDDDCDGIVDDVAGIGASCGQSNTSPCTFGTIQCVGTSLACVGNVDPSNETCNGIDDNCNGQIDESIPPSVCVPSGTDPSLVYGGLSQCKKGMQACGGACIGFIGPSAEACDGVDNDCDGMVDDNLALGACNVPPPPPAGGSSPCVAGTQVCNAGVLSCQGSVGPTGASDTCGVDANCDGVLTGQPDFQNDNANCGTCGNDCNAGSVHANWGCQTGACVFQGCETGYHDLDGDESCEYACSYTSAQEFCNAIDDDCDGQIDEAIVAVPAPAQVCGVSPSANRPECTNLVIVACVAGAWQCTFPAGVCNPTCASATEICDAVDNNCDGLVNENTPLYGRPCASDDAHPVPGDGPCRRTGVHVCNGPNATVCSALKAPCTFNPTGCTETCDGVDNDCDGSVDEPYTAKGTNPIYFLKPVVTRISATRWIASFEASRPNATATTPGTGNGYYTSAPLGTTLDKTKACSVQNKLPWFNVTPDEAEQTCNAMGGFVCARSDWTTACQATQSCNWGYNPRGPACISTYTASKFCNLGPSYDFDPALPGDQDGLLKTGSPLLANCWADWLNIPTGFPNSAATAKIYDITGNLREITKETATVYALMGGAFNTDPAGATCTSNPNQTSNTQTSGNDLGFRCCFSVDPTL